MGGKKGEPKLSFELHIYFFNHPMNANIRIIAIGTTTKKNINGCVMIRHTEPPTMNMSQNQPAPISSFFRLLIFLSPIIDLAFFYATRFEIIFKGFYLFQQVTFVAFHKPCDEAHCDPAVYIETKIFFEFNMYYHRILFAERIMNAITVGSCYVNNTKII